MTEATRSAVIDCDVHCRLPSAQELFPFLSEYWVEHLRLVRFRQFIGVDYTYPPWSRMMTPAGCDQSLEGIRENVLGGADAAVLHAYYGVESQQHPYFAQALATAVNRWVKSEYLDQDPRLLASAVIAPQNTTGAVEEVRRLASDRQFVQVLLPARAIEPYGSQRYWPIWEAAAEAGMTLAITYGGSTGTPPTPAGWVNGLFEEYAGFQQVFAAHVLSLITSGIFTRLPDLKVVVMESGWTWLPGLMWRMDTEWNAARREIPWLEHTPSEYVRRHVRLTTQPIDAEDEPARLQECLEQLGSTEMLMFGSDFPRAYTPSIDDLLAGVSSEQKDQILWSNAAQIYGIDSPTDLQKSSAAS